MRSGQTWRMGDSNLQVELVGKRLVHYRLLKPGARRAPAAISAKEAVERYLRHNKATLVRRRAVGSDWLRLRQPV